MNVLAELRRRFGQALSQWEVDVPALVDLVRRSQDPKFGDYQANLAMPLAKQLGRPPREVAQQIIDRLQVDDFCQAPSIEGPGFINLRLRDDWISQELSRAVTDPRLGISAASPQKTCIVDYSAPNVAKPMHVGHIRSTVIGDSLYRTLKFQGHRVIGDNHIGDWGTQFGMILYGFRNFKDPEAYTRQPVHELARLYRLVNQLADYHKGKESIPQLERNVATREAVLARWTAEHSAAASLPKEAQKERRRFEQDVQAARAELDGVQAKRAAVENDSRLAELAAKHPTIATDVLAETALLHEGDAERLRLWREFLPHCLEEIEPIYKRLGIRFDHTLGESFYHDQLADVIDDLRAKGLAVRSEGATCVFVEGSATPMIVQKQDGAFLYATTDLATIRYRMQTWKPDAILYVVDARQRLHFEQLFAVARLWGYTNVELTHVSFGTILGDDGRPFKTRSGDTVDLAELLEEAVRRAYAIVSANDDAKPAGAELSDIERQAVAEAIGIGALKYADLSQNRESDYVFSYDKMLAMNGNTATYIQYAHARVRSIFAKGQVDIDSLRRRGATLILDSPAERGLALELLRCAEAIDQVVADYRPNHLTTYLFDLANRYSTFFEACPVLKAESPELRNSRLLLCDLTARTLRLGLELLGISVVEKM